VKAVLKLIFPAETLWKEDSTRPGSMVSKKQNEFREEKHKSLRSPENRKKKEEFQSSR
jgi:hypothetical protein